MMVGIGDSWRLKILSFLSFQISQEMRSARLRVPLREVVGDVEMFSHQSSGDVLWGHSFGWRFG